MIISDLGSLADATPSVIMAKTFYDKLSDCGDSHSATHGAFGALAFGIGASECGTALATQTLWQKPARTMCVVRGRAWSRFFRKGHEPAVFGFTAFCKMIGFEEVWTLEKKWGGAP